MIDLDRFKAINDTLGHPIGDKLLKEVAPPAQHRHRPADMITRFGGDEFVVLQTAHRAPAGRRAAGAAPGPHAQAIRSRSTATASTSAPRSASPWRPTDGVDADELLKKADMALYAAKNGGGGDHRFFAMEMEEAVQERRALELDLREALGSEQFQLHYQPLVDLRTGRVTTCEALLRWKHPVRGECAAVGVHPGRRGDRPDHRARRMGACTAPASRRRPGRTASRSPSTCRRSSSAIAASPLQVVSALAKSGLPAHRLELEITERVLLEDSDGTLATMQQLKNLGVGILARRLRHRLFLAQLPAQVPVRQDQDRPVVHPRSRADERDARAIIGAVASLGAGLDKIVVAEGIETEEQMKLVTAQGCHEGQGYFFGRPMSGDAIRARLETPMTLRRWSRSDPASAAYASALL